MQTPGGPGLAAAYGVDADGLGWTGDIDQGQHSFSCSGRGRGGRRSLVGCDFVSSPHADEHCAFDRSGAAVALTSGSSGSSRNSRTRGRGRGSSLGVEQLFGKDISEQKVPLSTPDEEWSAGSGVHHIAGARMANGTVHSHGGQERCEHVQGGRRDCSTVNGIPSEDLADLRDLDSACSVLTDGRRSLNPDRAQCEGVGSLQASKKCENGDGWCRGRTTSRGRGRGRGRSSTGTSALQVGDGRVDGMVDAGQHIDIASDDCAVPCRSSLGHRAEVPRRGRGKGGGGPHMQDSPSGARLGLTRAQGRGHGGGSERLNGEVSHSPYLLDRTCVTTSDGRAGQGLGSSVGNSGCGAGKGAGDAGSPASHWQCGDRTSAFTPEGVGRSIGSSDGIGSGRGPLLDLGNESPPSARSPNTSAGAAPCGHFAGEGAGLWNSGANSGAGGAHGGGIAVGLGAGSSARHFAGGSASSDGTHDGLHDGGGASAGIGTRHFYSSATVTSGKGARYDEVDGGGRSSLHISGKACGAKGGISGEELAARSGWSNPYPELEVREDEQTRERKHFAMNREIMACRDAWEILDLCDSRLREFNHVNVVTAFDRIAKFEKGRGSDE
mmetsp:Transcript_133617/g.427248  ORF Transcript_133617/g.427248 Transcript_133617/m.427248 type:complete len:609 (+) Transcript_133617:107-1933(+)